MRSLISLPSANAVGAGQTATFDVPARDLYHGISIFYTESGVAASQAVMEAAITEIRLKIDGKVQRRFSAASLFKVLGFYGDTVDAGYLPIYFSEPWRRTTQGEDALAWGMADVSTFTIEIDIAIGRTAPALSAKAMIERVSRPLGIIKKWRQFTVPATNTGIYNLTTLPKGDAYMALHMFSANVADVEVKIEGREEFKGTRADLIHWYARHGLQMQTGVFTIAFDQTNRVADALPTRYPGPNNTPGPLISDFRIDINMSAGANFLLLTEVIGTRD